MTDSAVDHLWQGARWPEALDTTYFVPDDRSIADHAGFAMEFAGLLTYFDASGGAHSGPGATGWSAFFEDDLTFLLARIAAPASAARKDPLHHLALWYDSARRIAQASPMGPYESGFLDTLERVISAEMKGALPGDALRDGPQALRRLTDPPRAGASQRMAETRAGLVAERLAPVARETLDQVLSQKHDHAPQIGLFLAFLHVLKVSQTQLNALTERHLAFYYAEVLRLSPAPAQPDHTWLTFRLTPDAGPVDLPEGAVFVTAPDGAGATMRFATRGACRLGKGRVAAPRSVALDTDARGDVTRIHAYADRELAPGRDAPFFHDLEPTEAAQAEGLRQGLTGIALSGPVLALGSGTREIAVTLRFEVSAHVSLPLAMAALRRQAVSGRVEALSPRRWKKILDQVFVCMVSTPEGARIADGLDVRPPGPEDTHLSLKVTLGADFPALSGQDGGDPALTLLFNPQAKPFGYSALAGLIVAEATVCVAVSGLAPVTVPEGAPVAKPIAPFGANAVPGDRFALTHPDLGDKPLHAISLAFDWLGLPVAPEDLQGHYASYGLETTNDTFRAELSLVARHQPARPLGTEETQPLFTTPDGAQLCPHPVWDFALDPPLTGAVPALEMRFAAPGYGFGSAVYPDVLARAVLARGQPDGSIAKLTRTLQGKAPPDQTLPPPPVLAKLANPVMGFRAGAGSVSGGIALASVGPFGHRVPRRTPTLSGLDFPMRSARYLTLTGVAPGGRLCLLAQLEDTSRAALAGTLEDPRHGLTWHYLARAGWQPLPIEALVLDETEGFQRTGCLEVAVPPDAEAAGGTVQLALTAPAGDELLTDLVGLTAQAVRVQRLAEGGPWDGQALPAARIRQAETPVPGLKSVLQPLPSQGGRAAEDDRSFRTRISERLRHKDRAIVARDYEQLVLQAFPEIFEAKCIGDEGQELTIVVTPRRPGPVETPAVVPLHRRQAVAAFLRRKSAAWQARFNIVNPSYEPVRVQAWFATRKGHFDEDLPHKLRQAARRFIAGWMQDPAQPMPIGTGRLRHSDLAAVLRAVPGVEVVTGLAMMQALRTDPFTDRPDQHGIKDTARLETSAEMAGAWLAPATPFSVLVPDAQITLRPLPTRRDIGTLGVERDLFAASFEQQDLWRKDPRRMPRRPAPTGIGALTIGASFVISDTADALPPHDLPDPGHPGPRP